MMGAIVDLIKHHDEMHHAKDRSIIHSFGDSAARAEFDALLRDNEYKDESRRRLHAYALAERDTNKQLRAQVAELQAARTEAGAIDGVPLAELIHEQQDAHDFCIEERNGLRAQVAEQARQLEQARDYLTEWRSTPFFESRDEWEKWSKNLAARVDAWLAVNAPAPDRVHHGLEGLAAHRDTICTCGAGGATMPEYHAADCALYRMFAPAETETAREA